MVARNLVVFMDGTGNDKASGYPTNVALLSDRARNGRVTEGPGSPPPWQDLAGAALDAELDRDDIEQLTHYVAGVGSNGYDVIGQATGTGISRNILDGYGFLARVYRPGDRIWLFGFSRGAYSARSLGGLVGLCGLPVRRQGGRDIRHDATARAAACERAYKVYRIGSGLGEPGRIDRSAKAAGYRAECAWPEHADPAERAPYFIGVWDTVRSLGIPIYRYELELPWWQYLFHDAELNPRVRFAFQALAIDDKRLQFHPVLWNEPTLAERDGVAGQVMEQVWFPGAHADVGGGYEERGLSDGALAWMIHKTRLPPAPLLYGVDPMAGLSPRDTGTLHDPRAGFMARMLYKEVPRSVAGGIQDVEGRSLARRLPKGVDATLHPSWEKRLRSDPAYDTPHLRGHPDYDRLRPPP